MKAYTDLVQSRKLAEILPLESADMYFEPSVGFCTEPSEVRVGDIKYAHPRSVPCWSLAALLELTPNDVSLLHFEDVYQAVYDVKPYYITNRYDNPLDAVFEMVCWLKENNKL